LSKDRMRNVAFLSGKMKGGKLNKTAGGGNTTLKRTGSVVAPRGKLSTQRRDDQEKTVCEKKEQNKNILENAKFQSRTKLRQGQKHGPMGDLEKSEGEGEENL